MKLNNLFRKLNSDDAINKIIDLISNEPTYEARIRVLLEILLDVAGGHYVALVWAGDGEAETIAKVSNTDKPVVDKYSKMTLWESNGELLYLEHDLSAKNLDARTKTIVALCRQYTIDYRQLKKEQLRLNQSILDIRSLLFRDIGLDNFHAELRAFLVAIKRKWMQVMFRSGC